MHGLAYRRTREKNLDTLTTLGLLPSEMLAVVAALHAEQALGPPWNNAHPDHPEELTCEFGTVVKDHAIYVKLCIVGFEDGARGAVISFHFAEKPLVLPYE